MTLVFRFVFCSYNSIPISRDIFTNWSTYRLDLAVLSYFLALLLTSTILTLRLVKKLWIKQSILFVLFLSVVSFWLLIELGSIAIYQEWGTTLDVRVIGYSRYGAFWRTIYAGFGMIGLCLIFVAFIFVTHLIKIYVDKVSSIKPAFVNLLVIPLLIIPARGGLQKIPIKTSVVFENSNQDQSYAKLNKSFHFIRSLIIKNRLTARGVQLEYIKASKQILLAQSDSLSTATKPNIVLLVLEGIPYSAIDHMDGGSPVMPFLRKLRSEALIFDNIYASGFRTDQGLLSIFSGIPAVPVLNLMNDVYETHQSHSIIKDLKHSGYQTSFTCGTDLEFSQMRRYFNAQGIDHLFGQNQLGHTTIDWGVEDGLTLINLSNQLNKYEEPFFASWLSIDTHQPFDSPEEKKFGSSNVESLFLSSAFHIDAQLDIWYEKAKQEDWFGNTIFVVTSDHGSAYLGNLSHTDHKRYHVPLMVFGPALHPSYHNQAIRKYGNSHDIPVLINKIVGLPSHSFVFGSDLLDGKKGDGFWITEYVMGCVNDSICIKMNHTTDVILECSNKEINPNQTIKKAHAILDKLINQNQ